MKGYITIIILASLLLTSCGFSSNARDFEQLYNDGKYQEMLERIEELPADQQDSIEVSIFTGKAELKLGNTNAAKEIFHEALERDENLPEAYVYLSRIYFDDRQLNTSISLLQDGISLYEKNNTLRKEWEEELREELIRQYLFDSRDSFSNTMNAISDLRNCCRVNQKYYINATEEALQENNSNIADAKRLLQWHLEEQPTSCKGTLLMGRAYTLSEEFEKAEEYYEKALSLCPKDSCNPQMYYAFHYYKKGDFNSMQKYIDSGRAINQECYHPGLPK
jgi:tetratricopeptide (TPR) repeat protein